MKMQPLQDISSLPHLIAQVPVEQPRFAACAFHPFPAGVQRLQPGAFLAQAAHFPDFQLFALMHRHQRRHRPAIAGDPQPVAHALDPAQALGAGLAELGQRGDAIRGGADHVAHAGSLAGRG